MSDTIILLLAIWTLYQEIRLVGYRRQNEKRMERLTNAEIRVQELTAHINRIELDNYNTFEPLDDHVPGVDWS
jgi:hypothetical protein